MIPLLTAALIAGLLGSMHCVGMCGGFAAGCSRARMGLPAWHTGRVLTYGLLGALAGAEATPVPADRLDLDELVDWLDAVQPLDHIVLLRQLGDLALFRAGVFPDSIGAKTMSSAQAEHLGRSVGMTDDELNLLVDHGSATPGLDALETLSSAWYRAAAESSPTAPVLLRDVACRIRAARRFLNYAADHYLHRAQPCWAPGF